jgi:hypothetical protein
LGGACNRQDTDKKFEKSERKDELEELGVDEIKLLKCII